jgi:GT2 family glycosyltransferase
MTMRTAVITIVAGRDLHLVRQHEGLQRLTVAADVRIVVAMDPAQTEVIRSICGPSTQVVALQHLEPCLPLARARNTGARHALAAGAELLVFLDADCIPAPDMVNGYRDAAARTGPALLCGPVAYLPPAPPDGYPTGELAGLAAPHPARPAPAGHELIHHGDHRLFWSLSFATRACTWHRLGGFCERYHGYGAEDTDLGQLARARSIEVCWVGAARAYHQHHPTTEPPVEHIDDILRNAAIFHERWGWWPMHGWLAAFAALGLIDFDGRGWRRIGY